MKKLIIILLSLAFCGSLLSQEKYTVPELTCDQKLSTVKFQSWGMIAASINFAKSQGVSPKEYGLYVGEIFAKGWNPEIEFKEVVVITSRVWSSFITDADGEIKLKEHEDGSVSLLIPRNGIAKYFSGEGSTVPVEDIAEYFQGVLVQIEKVINCQLKLSLTEESMVIFHKKISG